MCPAVLPAKGETEHSCGWRVAGTGTVGRKTSGEKEFDRGLRGGGSPKVICRRRVYAEGDECRHPKVGGGLSSEGKSHCCQGDRRRVSEGQGGGKGEGIGCLRGELTSPGSPSRARRGTWIFLNHWSISQQAQASECGTGERRKEGGEEWRKAVRETGKADECTCGWMDG